MACCLAAALWAQAGGLNHAKACLQQQAGSCAVHLLQLPNLQQLSSSV